MQQDTINKLLEKLGLLQKKQDEMSKEINKLHFEIIKLKTIQPQLPDEKNQKVTEEITKESNTIEKEIAKDIEQEAPLSVYAVENIIEPKPTFQPSFYHNQPATKSNYEKFIGENLISVIGILITIIGVAIGVKYSIDHNLVNPLTRIVIAYIFGAMLLLFGIRYKIKYHNYSAILVSGAMAIFYFNTFVAYSKYNLFPNYVAFILMLIFTIFTVIAALHYNRSLIAHIGLIGAYAVPFLLSNNSGQVLILFTYITIINVGILIIAAKKYWKSLHFTAFGLTWLIFSTWFFYSYRVQLHFNIAFIFSFLFFIIFYFTFCVYKILQNIKFNAIDIVLILSNAFIFYGLAYTIMQSQNIGKQLLGLFTLFNALIHFIVSAMLYKRKLNDKNIFYLITGLVLIFITIAIPVQLDGHWVTMLWALEALLLFWIGRTKNVNFYELAAYALIPISIISLLLDWQKMYSQFDNIIVHKKLIPLFNIPFLTSMIVIGSLGLILYLNKTYQKEDGKKLFLSIGQFTNLVSGLFIFICYSSLFVEISNYWHQRIVDNGGVENFILSNSYRGQEFSLFQHIWLQIYSMFFFAILALININKIKSQILAYVNIIIIVLNILVFLTSGLVMLGSLRESFMHPDISLNYENSSLKIWLRYIAILMVAFQTWVLFLYVKNDFLKFKAQKLFTIFLAILFWLVMSSEILNWIHLTETENSKNISLSIFWGIYSVVLIILGIWKEKSYLRICGMILMGITLFKLIFYDLSFLETIAKTVIFVLLGLLLLIISYLYNRYTNKLFNDQED